MESAKHPNPPRLHGILHVIFGARELLHISVKRPEAGRVQQLGPPLPLTLLLLSPLARNHKRINLK
jgi:hypothetical protein